MKLKLLAFCILAMLVLTGCKGSGGAAGGFGGSVFAGGSGILGGGSSSGSGFSSGGGSGVGHTPEPATVALLGGGFAAFAFLKRKKRK